MAGIKLTSRDEQIVRLLAAKRAAPLDVLATRFFARDPRTHKPSKSPLRACLRRLMALERAGVIKLEPLTGPETDDVRPALIYLSDATAKHRGVSNKNLHRRHKEHQVQTMRAVEGVRLAAEARGGELVSYKLETELLAAAYAAKIPTNGQEYDGFPDALVVVAPTAGAAPVEMPLEYVTSSYSDAQIRDKARTLPGHTAWYADDAKTAARVTRLLGAKCRVV